MKKITLLFATLLCVQLSQAQNVNIPDANFKAALVADYSINTNHDGEIQVSEATAFTGWIDVSNKNISNLIGIEAFTALTSLWCNNNQLTSLDVSQNPTLTELYCANNQLTSLDVSQNTALTVLYCANNQLTSIDVSQNTALTHLECSGNQLTSLDVSQNTALTFLICHTNQLTNINVSQNLALTILWCGNNPLVSIDISQNTALTNLLCSGNQLTSLDVSQNTALTDLTCNNNQLTSLNLSQNPELTKLSCYYNQLTSLNVSQNPALTVLECDYNQLTSLNVSQNPALTVLYCSRNQLISIDVSQNPALVQLNCRNNQLTNLILNQNSALTELKCDNNQLTSLNVNQSPELTNLYCGHNQLTSLNLSQNPALMVLWCDINQLTSLDISQNPALTELYCTSNQLSNLNVSQNPALIELRCSYNQLTSLDVSLNPELTVLYCFNNLLSSLNVNQNTELTNLYCDHNQLTSLNLSQNPALTELYCTSNQLSNLNVSQNPALTKLYCFSNQLTSLNVSQNPALIELHCSYNQLTSLNVKNGNNLTITNSNFNTGYNPNLFCIEVDNPVWSTANWTFKDSWAAFGSNCLYGIVDPNQITGRVLLDNNCIQEGSEIGLSNIIVKTEPVNFYGITDNAGYYKIHTDTGTYKVSQLITEINNSLFINPLCPSPNYYTVSFDTLAQVTTGLDFYNEGVACPYLKMDVNSDRRRRCFRNNTYVKYCNEGYADASNVLVHVQFPEYVNLINTNYAYTQDGEGTFIFDIGVLAKGACGTIHIVDSVSCEIGITGLTQCTKAWITPINDCIYSLDTVANNEWDKSSVSVAGVCVSDSSVRFTITNTGQFVEGDMDTPSEYRIYADNQLVNTGTFQLDGGGQLVLEVPANGQTIRLEADQNPAHPGNSHPRATVEACGEVGATISLGFVNAAPQDDEDAEIEISCMEILDSYDPNDKSVSPQGITNNNYLMPGIMLDYQIRFQNTGSDTAYTVVVIDTLSNVFDVSTIEWGVSSHPYVIDVSGYGRPILKFTFNQINLPDSITDEPNSHGFVKFKIAPYDTLPMGTIIQNFADIYFDYNLPVRTNTTHQILSDTVPTGSSLEVINVTNISEFKLFDFKAIPNPFSSQLMLDFGVNATYKVKIMDMLGKEVFSTELSGTKGMLSTTILPSGIYILQVTSEKGVGVKKIVKK